MTFLNAALLLGLAAVALPVAIHFFSRKRYEDVDWAAMQFLSFDSATRRRINLDHLLLLAIRCAAVAALALALAAPSIPRRIIPQLLGGRSKDVIVLIDNSASMAGEPSEAAHRWATRLIESLGSSDRLAIYSVRRGLNPILPVWSTDRERARLQLNVVPTPASRADWPSALAAANALFDDRSRDCHIVAISDGQKFGLADERTMTEWPLALSASDQRPQVWFVALPPQSAVEKSPPIVIDPIEASRGIAIANREILFRTQVRHPKGAIPSRVSVEWDGRTAGEVPVSAEGSIELTRRFPAGIHVLSIRAGTTQRDFAFEVATSIPVLVVDGDVAAHGPSTIPLSIALAPAKMTTSGFTVRTIPIEEFGVYSARQDVAGPDTAPRLIVLANVEKLSVEQNQAIETYLKSGGAVLVTLGDRCKASAWNQLCLRAGQGWLPARIDRMVEGSDASPQPAASSHPALRAFRESLPGGLASARFPQFWKLDPTAAPQAVVACSLSTGDPFLVDRGFGRGRAMMACVSFDRTGQTNFTSLPDYVRLIHELGYAQAGTRSAERNLLEGSPIVFTPNPAEPEAGVALTAPDRPAQIIPVSKWPLVYSDTSAAGVYRLTTSMGRIHYYAVNSDPRERDPTLIDDKDRSALTAAVPGLSFIERPDEIVAGRNEELSAGEGVVTNVEIWWIVLLSVLALFGGELWLARRKTR